jgi:hypothetical protein
MGLSPGRVKPKTKNWYLLLLRDKAHSIKEKEQRLIGSESE